MNGGLGCTVDGEAGHGNEGEPRRDVDQRRFRALPQFRQKCHRNPDQAQEVGAASRRPLMMTRLPNGLTPLPDPCRCPAHRLSTLLIPASYDPRILGPILALEAGVVELVWGPRTLMREEWCGT